MKKFALVAVLVALPVVGFARSHKRVYVDNCAPVCAPAPRVCAPACNPCGPGPFTGVVRGVAGVFTGVVDVIVSPFACVGL